MKRHGLFLLAGRKLVPEAIKRHKKMIVAEVLGPNHQSARLPQSYQLNGALFRQLDVSGTDHPLLVLKLPRLESAKLDQAPTTPQVISALGDPANVGALVRVSLAFGIKEVVLLKESASPFHPKALRASSGTSLDMKFLSGPSLSLLGDQIHPKSFLALDLKGENIQQFKWSNPFRLLVGEEGRGLPENLTQAHRLNIPIEGGVESLNAVSAVSVALYASRIKN